MCTWHQAENQKYSGELRERERDIKQIANNSNIIIIKFTAVVTTALRKKNWVL